MEEKKRFIETFIEYKGKFSELCKTFGISRKTGYKYIARYKASGLLGLTELSKRPRNCPSRIKAAIEKSVLLVRHTHPGWGGEKIRRYLTNKGYKNLPTEKTMDRILKRNGLITLEESEKHKPWIRFEHAHPNDLWQMDFKGHFALSAGRCHPLTLLDDHSRFSLLIKACENERGETVKQALIDVFRDYGLPASMTMDNGSPWGYSGQQEHTVLSAWLIRLGIIVSHSRPGHPQTQGKLERFHRTLNLELLKRFTFATLYQAQEGFDGWRRMYNEERPHEAIHYQRPIDRYQCSQRAYPESLPVINYEKELLVRKVQRRGVIFFKGKEYRIGKAFYGHPVGLKETDTDGSYDVYFCHQRVVRIDLRYPA